jgi:hypothetical protein
MRTAVTRPIKIILNTPKTSATIPASVKDAWMQSGAGIESEWLERIVALLFALADLADRAGGASRSVRRTVLGILWPAEAVAREFLTGFPSGFDAADCANDAAGIDSSAIQPPRSAVLADDRAEAARLASSFRALALLLACLLNGMRNPRRGGGVFRPEKIRAIVDARGVGRPEGRARGPPRSA